MIQAQFLLGALETLLDCPTQAGGTGQFRQCCSGARKDQIVGPLRGIGKRREGDIWRMTRLA